MASIRLANQTTAEPLLRPLGAGALFSRAAGLAATRFMPLAVAVSPAAVALIAYENFAASHTRNVLWLVIALAVACVIVAFSWTAACALLSGAIVGQRGSVAQGYRAVQDRAGAVLAIALAGTALFAGSLILLGITAFIVAVVTSAAAKAGGPALLVFGGFSLFFGALGGALSVAALAFSGCWWHLASLTALLESEPFPKACAVAVTRLVSRKIRFRAFMLTALYMIVASAIAALLGWVAAKLGNSWFGVAVQDGASFAYCVAALAFGVALGTLFYYDVRLRMDAYDMRPPGEAPRLRRRIDERPRFNAWKVREPALRRRSRVLDASVRGPDRAGHLGASARGSGPPRSACRRIPRARWARGRHLRAGRAPRSR